MFLIIGFIFSMKLSGGGAETIMKWGEQGFKSAGGWAANRGKNWARSRMPGYVTRLGERMATARTPGSNAFVRGLASPLWAVGRATGRTIGPAVLEGRRQTIEKTREDAKKTLDPNLLLSKLRSAGTDDERIGILSEGLKKGKGWKKVLQDNLTNDEVIRLASAANRFGQKGDAERMARAFLHKFNDSERENVLMNMGFKSYAQLDASDKAEWDAKKYQTITHNIIGEAEKDDIEDFAKTFWVNSPAARRAIQNFWGGPQLSKAADVFGRRFVDDYMQHAEDPNITPNAPDWFLQINSL